MHKGYLCIVLHAHLPYIRHPEYDYFLEENWLYEAITETYIPLLDVFERLINDDIDFRITLSLSPALIEMLNDNLLRDRYKRHIEQLIELSEKEGLRTKGDINFEPIVRMYNERFQRIRYLFEDVYKRDIVSAFKALQNTGKFEFITSAETHAFLPTISMNRDFHSVVFCFLFCGLRVFLHLGGMSSLQSRYGPLSKGIRATLITET